MREIRLKLCEPTILLNRWQRMHWQARRRHVATMATCVRKALGYAIPKYPIEQCEITVRRYSVGVPDWDGLYGGLKPLLDCLVVKSDKNPHGLGVIRDDSPHHIVTLDARPVRVPSKAEQRTEVVILEVVP